MEQPVPAKVSPRLVEDGFGGDSGREIADIRLDERVATDSLRLDAITLAEERFLIGYLQDNEVRMGELWRDLPCRFDGSMGSLDCDLSGSLVGPDQDIDIGDLGIRH